MVAPFLGHGVVLTQLNEDGLKCTVLVRRITDRNASLVGDSTSQLAHECSLDTGSTGWYVPYVSECTA